MNVEAIQGATVTTTLGAVVRRMAEQVARLQGNTSSVVIQARTALQNQLSRLVDIVNTKAPTNLTTWAERLAWADTIPVTYEEGGNVWQQIGEGLADAGRALANLGNRANPVFVAARAATLTLVRQNFRGMATKMHQRDPDKMRNKWEAFGGTWDKMREAIDKGAAEQPTVNALPFVAIAPALDTIAQGGTLEQANQAGNDAASGRTQSGGASTLWRVAQVVLLPLLSLMGINRQEVEPTPRQDAAAGGAGQGSAGGLVVPALLFGGLLVLSQSN